MWRSRALVGIISAISVVQGWTAEIIPGPVVEPYRLVRVRPAAGERVWVLPWVQQPTAIDVVTAENGDIVWTGPPGVYAVLWLSADGQGQSFVRIGDSPNPPVPVPPGPGPKPPQGFAGKVYEKARAVNRPADCGRVAGAFRNVLSAVRAGGIKKREDAVAAIAEQVAALRLDTAWTDFGRWISQMANERAQTMQGIDLFFAETVEGLEAAAK